MALVFKLEPGAVEATANVGNSNFKSHYPEVNRSMAWLELVPYIEQATDTYVLPYIGSGMYNAIVTAYHADTLTDAVLLKALNMMQRAVAYYTIMHALPKKLGVIASMGAVNQTPSGGAAPISQWTYHNQLMSITKDGDTYMDALLQEFHAQVVAGNDDFDPWKNHPAFMEGKSDYFRSVKEFQGYHSINNSHRTFLAIIPYITKATKRYILPIIGEAQHALLVTAIKTGGVSNAENALIDKIRTCLAEWTLYMAIPALTVLIEGDGIKVISSTDGMSTRANVTSAFYKEAAKDHQYACESAGKTFRADLIEFLFKNSSDYPDWQTSDFYINASTDAEDDIIGGGCSVFI